MLKIQVRGKFDQMYRDLTFENPEMKELVLEKIKYFKNNPDDTRLKNHALRENLEGKYAFSITGDIRIVYEWLGKTTVRFLAIGGHVEVY